MSLRTIGCLAAALLFASPALAQENGRYQLERGDGGFVRLDTVTGEMTLCRETGNGLSCERSREQDMDLRRDRDQLRDEVRELRRENERLRDELAHYDDYRTDELPSDEEMEEIAGWFERMMAIMMRTMRNVEDEMDCEENGDCREEDRRR